MPAPLILWDICTWDDGILWLNPPTLPCDAGMRQKLIHINTSGVFWKPSKDVQIGWGLKENLNSNVVNE